MRRAALLAVALAAAGCSSNCWEEEDLDLGGAVAHFTGGVVLTVRTSQKDDPQIQAIERVAKALRAPQDVAPPASLELVFRSTADRGGPPPQWLGLTLPLPLAVGDRLTAVPGPVPKIWGVGPALAERAAAVGFRIGWETEGPATGTGTGTVEVVKTAPLQLQVQLQLTTPGAQPVSAVSPAVFREMRQTRELCE